jgi:hypothetical protein
MTVILKASIPLKRKKLRQTIILKLDPFLAPFPALFGKLSNFFDPSFIRLLNFSVLWPIFRHLDRSVFPVGCMDSYLLTLRYMVCLVSFIYFLQIS